MNRLRGRLRRLERRQPAQPQLTFEQAMEQSAALHAWLKERGYADHLVALEAGETGPPGLEELLREQAAYDPKNRAWARIRKALATGKLPDEADVRLLQCRNGTAE